MFAYFSIMVFITLILVLMGFAILFGKGDFLIAGYNTASEKEKNKYHIKRLRKLVGGILFLVSAVMWMPNMFGELDNMQFHYVVHCIIFIAAIAVVVLANTWAKKK